MLPRVRPADGSHARNCGAAARSDLPGLAPLCDRAITKRPPTLSGAFHKYGTVSARPLTRPSAASRGGWVRAGPLLQYVTVIMKHQDFRIVRVHCCHLPITDLAIQLFVSPLIYCRLAAPVALIPRFLARRKDYSAAPTHRARHLPMFACGRAAVCLLCILYCLFLLFFLSRLSRMYRMYKTYP